MTAVPAPTLGLVAVEPPAPEPALADLRVIEMASGVAGPYCGKLLADFGADVIKVELPDGDPSRAVGPFPDGDRDAGALFLWLNTNKRGITLDWWKPAGRRALRELIAQADILVDSGPTSLLNRWGLGPRSLLRQNPRLIATSVTPFGRTGPWRDRPATDLIVSALAGMSFLNGEAGREPLREPGTQAEVVGGIFGCIGTMCALADRAVTGEGQSVDVASLEALLGILTPQTTQYSYQGKYTERGPRSTETLYRCQDGYVSLTAPSNRSWGFLADLFDIGDAATDPAVANEAARAANRDRMRAIIAPFLARHSRAELYAILAGSRVNAGMVLSIADLKVDSHLRERDFFASYGGYADRQVVYPGPPFRMEAGEWKIRRPAPRLGEHNDEVFGELLRYSVRRRRALQRSGVAVIGGVE